MIPGEIKCLTSVGSLVLGNESLNVITIPYSIWRCITNDLYTFQSHRTCCVAAWHLPLTRGGWDIWHQVDELHVCGVELLTMARQSENTLGLIQEGTLQLFDLKNINNVIKKSERPLVNRAAGHNHMHVYTHQSII